MRIDVEGREIVELLLRDFESRRLPAVLQVEAGIAAGEALTAADVALLDGMIIDCGRAVMIAGPQPDLLRLHRCAARMRDEVLRLAAANSEPLPAVA